MEFVWHDGGRAACGFVGTTGDCVARSIAIATGQVYRDVYDSLSSLSNQTARHGIVSPVINAYLGNLGWKARSVSDMPIPKGVVLVEFTQEDQRRKSGHMSCVIDHTVYDTWNPFEDADFLIESYWVCDDAATTISPPTRGSRPGTNQSRLTQREYERILKRVRALHSTASNHASTEGEIRNALRAMQSLMLEHNLSRNDIVNDDEVSRVGLTRRACPLNGSKACHWELSLANYLTTEVFPTVQFYKHRRGHRTLYWFYGPVDDVEQAIGLFREMLITIATAARLKYGGYSRGSGASYALGYVKGLPGKDQSRSTEQTSSAQNALMFTRTLAVQSAAVEWLQNECGVELQNSTLSRRGQFDPLAHQAGKRDGAKHEYSGPHVQKRIAQNRLP